LNSWDPHTIEVTLFCLFLLPLLLPQSYQFSLRKLLNNHMFKNSCLKARIGRIQANTLFGGVRTCPGAWRRDNIGFVSEEGKDSIPKKSEGTTWESDQAGVRNWHSVLEYNEEKIMEELKYFIRKKVKFSFFSIHLDTQNFTS
jgi:hypothetical protein